MDTCTKLHSVRAFSRYQFLDYSHRKLPRSLVYLNGKSKTKKKRHLFRCLLSVYQATKNLFSCNFGCIIFGYINFHRKIKDIFYGCFLLGFLLWIWLSFIVIGIFWKISLCAERMMTTKNSTYWVK